MSSDSPESLTQLLIAVGQDRADARDRLWSAVYHELQILARGQMARESPDHTLQTTALVHEAYMRLVGNEDIRWENRRHFFGAAANAMRQILIDHSKKKIAEKRGGGDRKRVSLEEVDAASDDDPIMLIAIDEALDALERIDSRKAEVVKLRFFAGLTGDEIAKVLGISPRTVDSDWKFIRAWLHRELADDESRDSSGGNHDS